MKLTLLGTGTSQGVPVVGCNCKVCSSDDPHDHRLRQSAIVSNGNTSLLIDTGPDLRQQLLRENISYVDAILYTHEHNDHVVGLDDIRPIYFNTVGNVPSYALKRVHDSIATRFAYMFSDNPYPGVAQIDRHDIDFSDLSSFKIGDIDIQPLHITHGRLDILGFRFGDIAYITDASYISEETISQLEGLEYLVINALHQEKHHSHFTLQESVSYIDLIQPKQAFITHISHLMGNHAEINATLPSHINLAHDGLVLRS